MFVTFLTAQQGTLRVSGKVSEESGDPLIGVNIQEKGTTNGGTTTDVDGNYTLGWKKGRNDLLLIPEQELNANAMIVQDPGW